MSFRSKNEPTLNTSQNYPEDSYETDIYKTSSGKMKLTITIMLETTSTTRKERRIAARKAQILDAAATIFSQKGYGSTTTKEIAEAADVSEGTLYNYFQNKQELLIGVAQAYANEVLADIESIQVERFEDMLAQLMANRFRRGRERRLFILFLYESRQNPDVHRYYVEEAIFRIIDVTEKRLATLIEAGKMRPVDPIVAGRMMCATIMGFAALFELGVPVSGSTPEQLGQEITSIYVNGLRLPDSGDEQA